MSPDSFHTRIRSSLADGHLQSALDANAERRQRVRLLAYGELGDVDALRRRAHAVRSETIAHLDEYLARFIERASANGMIVHRAADAHQAVEQVLEIARRRGATGRSSASDHSLLVAKSKTMLGEEIGLNHALQAAGLRVVETDLGEYIIQLRGESPAHIITPAVHLTRADVGRTFQEKLGLPYTEDVSDLTVAAHRVLRPVFLEADIGLTGVNFGIVETGGLCLITNEGNGRMVSTLPPVHIALMGIERLVPALPDLALMLRLLPRAASGLRSTVYTSLIHSPRRPGDPDGPQERHLILIDNGRSAQRAGPLADALLCIRCGACLNACPVFRELGGHAYIGRRGQISPYPGPIGSVLAPALFGQAEFGQLARASSLCGACQEACPVDIDLPKMLLRVRAGAGASTVPSAPDSEAGRPARDNAPTGLRWGLRLYAWVASSPRRFAAALWLAGRLSWLNAGRPWLRLPAGTGWGLSRDFPTPARRTFRRRWASLNAVQASDETGSSTGQGTSLEIASHSGRAGPAPQAAQSLLDRFLAQAAARECSLVACSAQELPARVLDLLRRREIRSILAWEPAHLPPGLVESLQDAGLSVSHRPDERAGAGLTGALAGLAETGGLALPGGPGRPLTASLLPAIHIAVLHAGDIYENLEDLLAHLKVQDAPALVLVSGPSRTADIEMTLTVGVHGPREVHIFCLT